VRILVVEDDAMLGDGLKRGLGQVGHAADWIRDGSEAELALTGEPYDVVILDLGFPAKGGLEVLRDLRGRGNRVPVVIITAQDAISQRVADLDAGADDYIVKPFDLDELAARIRAVQRRSAGRADPVIEHGALSLNDAGATRRYERRMRPVIESKQAAGRRMARWFVPDDRWRLAVRDLAIRASVWPGASAPVRRTLDASGIPPASQDEDQREA
jgi:two-component system response regulator QseB